MTTKLFKILLYVFKECKKLNNCLHRKKSMIALKNTMLNIVKLQSQSKSKRQGVDFVFARSEQQPHQNLQNKSKQKADKTCIVTSKIKEGQTKIIQEPPAKSKSLSHNKSGPLPTMTNLQPSFLYIQGQSRSLTLKYQDLFYLNLVISS